MYITQIVDRQTQEIVYDSKMKANITYTSSKGALTVGKIKMEELKLSNETHFVRFVTEGQES